MSALLLPEVYNAFTSPRPVSTRMVASQRMAETKENTGIFSDDVQQEAKAALESVGWARPVDDGEMTSEDPFVQQIDAGIQRDFGVGLDDLLNPAKVQNFWIFARDHFCSFSISLNFFCHSYCRS